MNKGIITRLKTIIDYYDTSVSAFAERIGVQRSSISHLLNGRNKPSLDFVMKLVTAFPEVDLYWLLQGKGKFPIEETLDKNAHLPQNIRTDTKKSPVSLDDTKTVPLKTKASKMVTSEEPERIVFIYSDGTFLTFKSKNG